MPYIFPENGHGKCAIVNNDVLTNKQKGRQIYLETIPEPEKGSLYIGKITMQRKGGTPDPESLQFKISPNSLFNKRQI